MLNSKVTVKWQTTLPSEVRKALGVRPGDKLTYRLSGDSVTIRVNPGTRSLGGSLSSTKGKGMSFRAIREGAAKNRFAKEQGGKVSE